MNNGASLTRGRCTDRLRSSKARLVYAIIEHVVDPLVGVVYLRAMLGGVEVKGGIFGKLVKLGIEHADNLGAFVVDDRLVLGVPQDGHGEAGCVLGISADVEIAEVLAVMVGIGDAAGRLVRRAKLPALFLHQVIHDGNANGLLKTF